MTAIVVGAWYQSRKIDRICDSIDRPIAENDRRMKVAERRHERAAAHIPTNRYN